MQREIDLSVNIAIIRPGDTLVVGLSRKTLSQADGDEYRTKLQERLPGIADVVVLADCTALAAYRPDGDS